MIKKIRRNLLELTSGLSIGELNEVPAGFNNNIIWNMGHVIAAQQGVCYLRAGVPLVIEQSFFDEYKPGTKPGRYITEQEVDSIRQLLLSTLERFETDYQKKLFENYTPWSTRYGVELNNIDDAANFLLFHEGLHTGYIMALKRAVKKQVAA